MQDREIEQQTTNRVPSAKHQLEPFTKMSGIKKISNTCGKKGPFARACKQKDNYKRKIRNITEEEKKAIGQYSDQSETCNNRIVKTNRVTDKNKYLTTRVKINGTEKKTNNRYRITDFKNAGRRQQFEERRNSGSETSILGR